MNELRNIGDRPLPWLSGEVGARLPQSLAALGPVSAWPGSLKNALGLMMRSGFPMFLVWGPERVLIYNEAYIPILGTRHPHALGASFWDVWPEVRAQIEPIIEAAFEGRESFFEDLEVTLTRDGSPARAWFTFSYSPVNDEQGRTPGALCACVETTASVRAREQLAEAHRRQTRMFEQAPGFICILEGPDHVFTFTNAAHKRLFGRDVTGLSVRDAHAELDGLGFFELLDRVYATGERYSAQAARSIAMRDGEPQEVFLDFVYEPMLDAEGRVYGIFCEGFDVTESHRARVAQEAAESRQRFLDRLTAATAHLADAEEILTTTTQMVGEHLRVSSCAYADMDEDEDAFTIRGDWSAPGSPTIVGRYRLADFGRKAVENLSAGLPLVINDNLTEIAPEEAATFQALGISATICMPLVKDGRLRALMAIHHKAPHAWTDEELALIREVTDRSWAHVERVGAEAELRAREEELRLITDALPVLISYIDADHRYAFMNAAYEAWFGRPREALQGRPVAEVLGAEAYGAVRPRLEEALGGRRVSFQSRMNYRNAGLRHIQADYIPRTNGAGDVLGVYALVSDVTERVVAETRLRESRAELERRLNAIPQMVWSTLPDGRHDFFNQRWYEFTGAPPGSTDGHGWIDIFHPEDRPRTLERWTASLQTGEPYEIEYRLRHHTGEYRWVLGRALAIRDEQGAIERWMGTCTDIDELKRTSGELQRTTALLTLISDSTPDLIYAKDLDSRIIYVNASGERVIGRPREQIVGYSDFDWAENKAQAAAIVANDRRVFESGEIIDADESFTSPDGETRTYRSLKAPLRDAAGRVIGLVGVTSDITERHRAIERERLLAREVDHRAKNLLTIVQSILRLTRADSAEGYARAVEDRVHALSRVHGLLAGNRWDGAQLRTLVGEELAPFAASHPSRVRISGPEVRLRPEAAQGVAMVLHELTTNAAKYGALSNDEGALAVTWSHEAGRLRLEWAESGGPPVRKPQRRGFGSTLIAGAIERQLHGELTTDWDPAGVRIRLSIPTSPPAHESSEL